jgi:CRP-like cAMP-binding protein
MLGDLIENEPAVLQALLRFLRDRLVDRLVQVSPLFAPYADSESHDLASRFRFLEVQSGTLLLQQGHRASGLFVLLAGQLEVVHTGDQGARRLGTLRPGGVFGEMSLLANQPAVFTVRATAKSFILQLPAAVFREVIMTHPQVLMYVAKVAEERRNRYQAIIDGDADYDAGRITLL